MLNKIIFSIILISFFSVQSSNAFAANNNSTGLINVLANVQISGAINKPGIYKIPNGTRLVDLISKAGGLRKDAMLNGINMTIPVSDGSTFYIASKTEAPKVEVKKPEPLKNDKVVTQPKNTVVNKKVENKPASKPRKVSTLVNVNTATEEELNSLPGIGDKLAKDIIKFRNKNGRFRDLSDLSNINGIGEKKLAKIKRKATI